MISSHKSRMVARSLAHAIQRIIGEALYTLG
ncbi:hypothetical protein LINPERHAP1_LOCUS29653 [Linum perenne]